MLIQSILLGLVGIIAVIDSRLIGRQNIGRPLILSTLAGLVLGDLRAGVTLGASLELISMGFVAIGAAGPPNMQLGSIIATSFAILSGASTEAALTIAIPVAVIGEFMSVIMRIIIAQFSHVADRAIEEENYKKGSKYPYLVVIWIKLCCLFCADFSDDLLWNRFSGYNGERDSRGNYKWPDSSWKSAFCIGLFHAAQYDAF